MAADQRPISVIVSDLHMGAADKYDDFVYQKGEFTTLVDGLTTGHDGCQGRVELLPTAELALSAMLISEGIYLSEKLGREVTADEVKKASV